MKKPTLPTHQRTTSFPIGEVVLGVGLRSTNKLSGFTTTQKNGGLVRGATFLIRLYQVFFSTGGFFSKRTHGRCVFYPSCSEYAEEAIKRYGVIKGGYFSARRVLRCHPWQKEHIDFLK